MDELSGGNIGPSYNEKSLMVDPRDQNKLFSVWNDWGDGLSIYRNFGEDINFTAPVWDKENQVYYPLCLL